MRNNRATRTDEYYAADGQPSGKISEKIGWRGVFFFEKKIRFLKTVSTTNGSSINKPLLLEKSEREIILPELRSILQDGYVPPQMKEVKQFLLVAPPTVTFMDEQVDFLLKTKMATFQSLHWLNKRDVRSPAETSLRQPSWAELMLANLNACN